MKNIFFFFQLRQLNLNGAQKPYRRNEKPNEIITSHLFSSQLNHVMDR